MFFFFKTQLLSPSLHTITDLGWTMQAAAQQHSTFLQKAVKLYDSNIQLHHQKHVLTNSVSSSLVMWRVLAENQQSCRVSTRKSDTLCIHTAVATIKRIRPHLLLPFRSFIFSFVLVRWNQVRQHWVQTLTQCKQQKSNIILRISFSLCSALLWQFFTEGHGRSGFSSVTLLLLLLHSRLLALQQCNSWKMEQQLKIISAWIQVHLMFRESTAKEITLLLCHK